MQGTALPPAGRHVLSSEVRLELGSCSSTAAGALAAACCCIRWRWTMSETHQSNDESTGALWNTKDREGICRLSANPAPIGTDWPSLLGAQSKARMGQLEPSVIPLPILAISHVTLLIKLSTSLL